MRHKAIAYIKKNRAHVTVQQNPSDFFGNLMKALSKTKAINKKVLYDYFGIQLITGSLEINTEMNRRHTIH